MADQVTTAGETLALSFSFADYPAGEGWAATFLMRNGAAPVAVTLSASGDAHVATVAAGTTAAWPPGLWDYAVRVTKAGAAYIAHEGTLAIKPNPAAPLTPTALEAQLAKVDEALLAIASGQGVASYSIQTASGSRNIQRMSLEDLRAHRRWLEGRIDAERVALGMRPKTKTWRRIGVRFS